MFSGCQEGSRWGFSLLRGSRPGLKRFSLGFFPAPRLAAGAGAGRRGRPEGKGSPLWGYTFLRAAPERSSRHAVCFSLGVER